VASTTVNEVPPPEFEAACFSWAASTTAKTANATAGDSQSALRFIENSFFASEMRPKGYRLLTRAAQ
jgi:hypothetical protein